MTLQPASSTCQAGIAALPLPLRSAQVTPRAAPARAAGAPPAATPRAPAATDAIAEAELLHRLRSGDEAAYALLVRRFGGRMLAVAQRLLRSEHDAHDAVQDAFLSAFKSINTFEGQAQVGTWLHRIVVNAALMKLRASKRRPMTECPIENMLPEFTSDGHRRNVRPAWHAQPDSQLEREELRHTIHRTIDMLPEDYRLVLMLRDIEELDTEETASYLGIGAGAVKTRLHRARMALRELLEMELV